MELNIFHQISSDNPNEVQNAIDLILKASEDPSYIQLLFQFLQTQECQSDLTIEKGIHLTILEIIRQNWNSFNDLSELSAANIYWNDEEQSEISVQLLEILFSTPYQRREHITECFRYIIIGSFPNNTNIAETLIQLLDEHSTSYEDVTTISNILVFWSKACGKSLIPDELLESVETIALEIINRFAAFSLQIDPPQSFCLLRFVSKSLKNFIKKLNSPFSCENLDNILLALVNSLTVDDESLREDHDFYLLKRSALNLFIELCSTFFPNLTENEEEELEIHAQYSIHFKENTAPILLQSLIECLSIEQDSYILTSIIYLFYLFLRFDIGDRLFLTTEFITNLIIPVARLTTENVNESEINPLQYISFNLSYTTFIQTRTQRNTTASLLGEILKNDQYIDDLYDFLLAPTVNQIDFEGRIFLMTKFVKATMSEYGPMIGEEIVEALVEQAKQVNLLPPFLIASLLMFMSSVLPFSDPELGCTLACECIIQSDSEIVICTASKLLRSSIKECDERVEIPITDIIPKLLNYASEVKYKHLTKSVEALIQIGGEDILPFIKDTVIGLLDLCNQSLGEESSKECSATLYSIFEIINPIPDDEPILVELSEIVLPTCIEFFANFPENNSFKDIFLLISLFNTKIDNATSTMIETYIQILQTIQNDIDVFLNAMDYIAFIMCPIIANPEFKENQKLVDSTFEISMQFINECMKEEDKDGLAYAILIVATIIQSIGEPGFIFIPHVCNALSGVDNKSATCLFSACVFALSSAFIVNIDEAIQKIPKEDIEFVLPQINKSTCQTYKELKMGMIFLLKATLLGFEDAYSLAVDNLQPLCERRDENEMNLEAKMATAFELILDQEDEEAEFAPLVIPFNLPSDEFDEFELFSEITQSSNLFQKLSPQQQLIVNDIFK